MGRLSASKRREVKVAVLDKHHPVTTTVISDCFSVSRGAAAHWVKAFREGRKGLGDAPRSGRPRKIPAGLANKLRKKTSRSNARKALEQMPELDVSLRTAQRNAHRGRQDLQYKKAQHVKHLRAANAKQRLDWCLANEQPSPHPIVFVDAKYCYMRPGAGLECSMRWVKADEIADLPAEGGGTLLHFYAAVAHGHKSSIVFVPPTPGLAPKGVGLTAAHFQTAFKLLYSQMKQWYGGALFTVIMDRAKPHTAISTQKWLASSGVTEVDSSFPAQSWDLNMIENCWGMLSGKLVGRRARSLRGYKRVIHQGWEAVQQVHIDTTIALFQERKQACIANRGEWPIKNQ
jgi:transposase